MFLHFLQTIIRLSTLGVVNNTLGAVNKTSSVLTPFYEYEKNAVAIDMEPDEEKGLAKYTENHTLFQDDDLLLNTKKRENYVIVPKKKYTNTYESLYKMI